MSIRDLIRRAKAITPERLQLTPAAQAAARAAESAMLQSMRERIAAQRERRLAGEQLTPVQRLSLRDLVERACSYGAADVPDELDAELANRLAPHIARAGNEAASAFEREEARTLVGGALWMLTELGSFSFSDLADEQTGLDSRREPARRLGEGGAVTPDVEDDPQLEVLQNRERLDP